MFYFNYNDFNVLGSSPEILVRLRKNDVTVNKLQAPDQEEEIKMKIKSTFLNCGIKN